MSNGRHAALSACLLVLGGCVGVAGPAGYGQAGYGSVGAAAPGPVAAGRAYYAPATPTPAASYAQPGPPSGVSDAGGTFLGKLMNVQETPEHWYERNKPQRMVMLMKCRQNPNPDQDPNCMAAITAEAHEEQVVDEGFILP